MNSTKPTRAPQIFIEEAGEETMLYSANSEALHILNPTARHIWDLCDGSHTIDQIEQKLRSIFDIPLDHNLKDDIQSTLAEFAAKGLLQ